MAETTYSYIISTDFPGGLVNTSNLKSEIQNTSSITISLNRIDTSGDDIDIVFNNVLSSGEKTILDGDVSGPAGGLIASHSSAIVEPIRQVATIDEVGGKRAKFGGHFLSASESQKKYSDFIITQDIHLQGAILQYVGMKLGDYAQLTIVHPSSISLVQSALSTNDTVVTCATNQGFFYNPLIIGGVVHVDFYDASENYKFSRKVSSVSGEAITLVSGVPEAIGTDWTIKSDISSFHIEESGFFLLGSDQFVYFQDRAYTEIIPEGMIFNIKLITTSVAGTRELTVNYIFRKPI